MKIIASRTVHRANKFSLILSTGVFIIKCTQFRFIPQFCLAFNLKNLQKNKYLKVRPWYTYFTSILIILIRCIRIPKQIRQKIFHLTNYKNNQSIIFQTKPHYSLLIIQLISFFLFSVCKCPLNYSLEISHVFFCNLIVVVQAHENLITNFHIIKLKLFNIFRSKNNIL